MAISMAGLASAMQGYNQGLARINTEEAAQREADLSKIKYDQAILDQKNKTDVDGIFGDGAGLGSATAKAETNGQRLMNSAMGLFSAKNTGDAPTSPQPASGGLNSKLTPATQQPGQSISPQALPQMAAPAPNITMESPAVPLAGIDGKPVPAGSQTDAIKVAAPDKAVSPAAQSEQPYKPIFSHAPQMQAKLDAWAALPENTGKDAMYRQAQERIDAIAKIEQSKAHQERMNIGENGLRQLFLANDVSGINKLMQRDMPSGKNYVLKNDLEGSGYTIYDGDKPVNKFADRDALGKAVSMRLHPELYQSASAEAQKAGMVESAKLPSTIEQETVKARVKGEAETKTATDTHVVEKNIADASKSRKQGDYYQAEASSIRSGNGRNGKGGSLTLAQERTNAEVDAARKTVAGMTPQEIAQRTLKTTKTGRENPDYDPNLERKIRIASTRKIGDDEEFDQQGEQADNFDAPSRFNAKSIVLGGKPIENYKDSELQKLHGTKTFASPAAKAKIDAELTHRTFVKDSAMKGNSLGELTSSGYKVIDSTGKHIGYYAR
jgi:hypothetical protein